MSFDYFLKIKYRLSSSLEFKSMFKFVDETLFDSRLSVLIVSNTLSHTYMRKISHYFYINVLKIINKIQIHTFELDSLNFISIESTSQLKK
jgi:hypothetical protein